MIFETRKLGDYYLENVVAPKTQEYNRIERAKEVANLYQGDENLCVPYTILFIASYIYGINIPRVLPGFMSGVLMDKKGSKPSQVLEWARSIEFIKNYFYLQKTDTESIRKALKISPLAIGVWDWWRVPKQGHFMALIDETLSGWLCVNWMDKEKHDFVTIPFDQPIQVAIAFGDLEAGKARSNFITASAQTVKTFVQKLWLEHFQH